MSTPSRPRTPKRSSMTSFGSASVSLTPTVKLAGSTERYSPASLARKEFTPSQAMTTHAVRSPPGRSVRTPTTRSPSRSSPVAVVEHTSSRAVRLGLAGQPRVEVGPVGGGAVVGRPAPGAGAEVDGEGLRRRHEHGGPAGHPALDGRLLPPRRDAACRAPAGRRRRRTCSSSPGTVRARAARPPGRRGPAPAPRQAPAGPAPTTTTSTSGIGRRSGCGAAPRAARRARRWRRLTMARSASCIIGQCGSVFTLTMWSGWPSPLVCCTAPLMPNAR